MLALAGVPATIHNPQAVTILALIDLVVLLLLGTIAWFVLPGEDALLRQPDGHLVASRRFPPNFWRDSYQRHLIMESMERQQVAPGTNVARVADPNRLKAELRIAPEEAFIAGMLHAIGKLVLDHVLPKAYARVIELAREVFQRLEQSQTDTIGIAG